MMKDLYVVFLAETPVIEIELRLKEFFPLNRFSWSIYSTDSDFVTFRVEALSDGDEALSDDDVFGCGPVVDQVKRSEKFVCGKKTLFATVFTGLLTLSGIVFRILQYFGVI